MIIRNEARSIGFFNLSGDTSIIKDGDYIIEKDLGVNSISGTDINLTESLPEFVSGTTTSPSSGATSGDIVMIQWYNVDSTLNKTNPAPVLFYKIVSISGSTVTVDRDLPEYSSGTPECSIIMAHERYIEEYRQYAINYLTESTLTFHSNYEEYGDPFPLWNLNIVYTRDIAGTPVSGRTHNEYNSIKYAGFKSYVELQQENEMDIMGIVHYSNPSPYNEYGEYFHRDFEDNTPSIYLPTIMWHKSPTATMGLILTTDVERKKITGDTYTSGIVYYDLIDSTGYVVGKVLPNYKMFIIEDAELLFALSYKSDRNWTLPNFDLEFSDGYGDCGICTIAVDYDVSGNTAPYNLIVNVTGISVESNNIIIVELKDNLNNTIYFEAVKGESGSATHIIETLDAGEYTLIIHDRGIAECSTEKTITIP